MYVYFEGLNWLTNGGEQALVRYYHDMVKEFPLFDESAICKFIFKTHPPLFITLFLLLSLYWLE